MNRLVIIGGGDFAKQVLSIMHNQDKYTVVGFYDDFTDAVDFDTIPILGKLDKIESDFNANKFDFIFFAVGYNRLQYKKSLIERFNFIPLATIIHPTAFIERDAEVGPGCLIYPFAYVGPRVQLNKCVVVNVYSYLPHDNRVGTCTFLSGGINIGGKVNIGECCFIGIGVTTNDSLDIGDNIFLGSNTLVLKSISQSGTYVGSPARMIKDDLG